MTESIKGRPIWDDALAGRLAGKLVLVGLTYFNESGVFIEQREFFGRVASVDRRSGILLVLEGRQGGEKYNLPPDTRSFAEAAPGTYTLRSTGETVRNPDFTVMFSFHRQPEK